MSQTKWNGIGFPMIVFLPATTKKNKKKDFQLLREFITDGAKVKTK